MEIDPNDFKQLLNILQKLVVQSASDDAENDKNDEKDEEVSQVSKKTTKKRKNSNTNNTKVKKKKFTNKFLSMKECSMHKSDVEIDKKLRKYPPTERARNFEYVKVRCRVCGKNDSVSPALAESGDRYKCNNCSTSPG